MARTRIISSAAAALLLFSAPCIAHDHATGIMKERMDAMSKMGKRMKAITDRLKKKSNVVAVKSDAAAIEALASHLLHQFPGGSTQKPTRAKPAIWDKWIDFELKAKALENETAKLAKMDAADLAALNAQVRAVTQTCTNCHDAYRHSK